MKLEVTLTHHVDYLEGVELDYWVARALDYKPMKGIDINKKYDTSKMLDMYYYNPFQSDHNPVFIECILDWNFIGKIIQRDNLLLTPPWSAYNEFGKHAEDYMCIYDDGHCIIEGFGKGYLEAIKRCIVKRKYGETITE